MAFSRLVLAVTVMLSSVTFNANGQDQTAMPVTEQSVLQEFLVAAGANDTNRLIAGLESGVPVDSGDASGRTALMIATHANAVDAAQVLIEAGADVNAKDQLQDSPYLYAGAEGRLEILKITIAAGADLKAVNRYGGTALIPAAHHGHVEVVRYLLTTKTDIDHVNFLGWTALLEAVILGDGGPIYQEIVGLLLQAGADTSIGDKEGVTAIDHATSRGQAEIVLLLVKHAEKQK